MKSLFLPFTAQPIELSSDGDSAKPPQAEPVVGASTKEKAMSVISYSCLSIQGILIMPILLYNRIGGRVCNS